MRLHFLMDQCIQITDNIKSGINEIIVTQQRQRLAEAEQRYMNNLKKLFDLLEVPSNRSFLFSSHSELLRVAGIELMLVCVCYDRRW